MTDMQTTPDGNRALAQAAVRGTFWVYFNFIANKALVFVANIILARILAPGDFGLLALGLLAINYIDTFTDLGVGSALIYEQSDPKRATQSAFTISLAMGLTLTVLAFLSAPFIADFFRDPRAVPIIQALSLSLFLTSLGAIPASLMKKQLDFRRRSIPEISKAVAKGGVSIGLALLGFGVWSLVWGQLAGVITSNVLYLALTRLRPNFSLDLPIARRLLKYGSQMVLVDLFGYILMNLDYLFIGRRLDTAQLGYYTMAFRIPELIILNVCNMVSQSIFPTYAKIQNDLAALKKGYLTTLRYVSMITLPAGIGMILTAGDFVRVFYTDRWSPAIPVMQLLALFTLIYSISYNAGDVYKATGKPSILNKIAVLRLAVAGPVLWFAAGFDILAVALGQVLVMLVVTPVQIVIAARILKFGLAEFLDALKPALIGALLMGAVITLASLGVQSLAPVLRLASLIILGVAAYGLTLWFGYPQVFHQVIGILTARTSKNKPAIRET